MRKSGNYELINITDDRKKVRKFKEIFSTILREN